MLMPKRVINVNGVVFGPGVGLSQGVKVAGVDFFSYENYDIAVEESEGIAVIKGFYNRR